MCVSYGAVIGWSREVCLRLHTWKHCGPSSVGFIKVFSSNINITLYSDYKPGICQLYYEHRALGKSLYIYINKKTNNPHPVHFIHSLVWDTRLFQWRKSEKSQTVLANFNTERHSIQYSWSKYYWFASVNLSFSGHVHVTSKFEGRHMGDCLCTTPHTCSQIHGLRGHDWRNQMNV